MTAVAHATLRATSTQPVACKICRASSPLFDVVDFHKSCREREGHYFALAGVAVYYRRCPRCGFLFTDAFDDWDHATLAALIYNRDYIQVDPDYTGARAAANAAFLTKLFEPDRGRLSVLDWGGGDGTLATLLRASGFASAESYDPFVAANATASARVFEVVTCFEVLEHLPDPRDGIATLAHRVADPGLVVFTTLLQPADIASQRGHWWYVAPRNGHISLFTRASLARAWADHDFQIASFNDACHVAYRVRPAFLRA